MRNRVFGDLEITILLFEEFFLSNREARTNPESGLAWRDVDVPETVDLELL
jgi:hypothetical protein